MASNPEYQTGLLSPPGSSVGFSPKRESQQEATPQEAFMSIAEVAPAKSDPDMLSDTFASPEPRRGAVGPYLEDLSHKVLDLSLNAKNIQHPFLVKHMSPAFRGKHDALPKVGTRDDHQSTLAEHLNKQPELSVTVLNASSDVDESRGRATIYLWYSLAGLEHGLRRENVAVLSWERKQGVWQITKHSGMRGPSGFS